MNEVHVHVLELNSFVGENFSNAGISTADILAFTHILRKNFLYRALPSHQQQICLARPLKMSDIRGYAKVIKLGYQIMHLDIYVN